MPKQNLQGLCLKISKVEGADLIVVHPESQNRSPMLETKSLQQDTFEIIKGLQSIYCKRDQNSENIRKLVLKGGLL
jgi:hypothetical protein